MLVCKELWQYQILSFPMCQMAVDFDLSVQCCLEPSPIQLMIATPLMGGPSINFLNLPLYHEKPLSHQSRKGLKVGTI